MKASSLFFMMAVMLQSIAPANDSGSIEGAVNIAGSAAPIPGAAVVLHAAGADAWLPSQKTITGNDGHFVFSNIPPTQYVIEVSREGYFAPSPASNSKTVSRTVTVRPKEILKELAIPLVPGGSISGRVIDQSGKPVVQAEIVVSQLIYTANGQPRLLDLSSKALSAVILPKWPIADDRGEYRAYGLPVGIYYVYARPSTPDLSGRRTYYPNVTIASQATKIVLGPNGAASGIDITMQTTPPFKISGALTVQPSSSNLNDDFPDRQSLREYFLDKAAGYFFFLESQDQNALSDAYPIATSGRLVPSEGGQFSISGIAPGYYTLIANNTRGRMAQIPIHVADRDINDLKLTIPSPVSLVGQVTVQGSNEDVSMSSLVIKLESVWQMSSNPTLSSAGTITKEGIISFTAIAPGEYRVAIGSLPADAYVADFRQGSRSIMRDGIVTVDDNPAPLDITINTAGGNIHGIVLDPNDKKEVAALITVHPQPQPLQTNMQPDLRIVANPDGSFVVPNLAPGEYKLFAWENIPLRAELNGTFMSEFNNRGTTLLVSPGATTNVRLNRISQQITIQ